MRSTAGKAHEETYLPSATRHAISYGILAYFFFVVRTSLGDFDVEPYAELPRAS